MSNNLQTNLVCFMMTVYDICDNFLLCHLADIFSQVAWELKSKTDCTTRFL